MIMEVDEYLARRRNPWRRLLRLLGIKRLVWVSAGGCAPPIGVWE